jgi:phage terminase Nu1 subunit (DNA packaging protein)
MRGIDMKKKQSRPAGSAVTYERIRQYREQGHDVGPKGEPDVAKVNRIAQVKQVLQQERGERHNEWRIRIDRADALRKEMELKKEMGHLVHVDDVRAHGFRIGRQVRDAMLNIPDRLATIIAAETNPDKIRDLLLVEVRQAVAVLETDHGAC